MSFLANFPFDSWPVQNCTVRTATNVKFHGLRLESLDAQWTGTGDVGVLRLKFELATKLGS